TLESLVPRNEFQLILEDLAWRAALRADSRSFERAMGGFRSASAFAARAEPLRLLARGNAGEVATALREAALKEPHLTLRFVRQLLERLESEDKEVRS